MKYSPKPGSVAWKACEALCTKGPMTTEELARYAGTSSRGIQSFMRAARGSGIVKQSQSKATWKFCGDASEFQKKSVSKPRVARDVWQFAQGML